MRLILGLMIFTSFSAWANPEMEAYKTETSSLIKEAQGNIKYKCECTVNFEINWAGFQTIEAMRKANYSVANFNKAMPSYCSDDGKAMACRIKSVRISFGSDTSVKFSGGIADLVTNGISHVTFDQVLQLAEKN